VRCGGRGEAVAATKSSQEGFDVRLAPLPARARIKVFP